MITAIITRKDGFILKGEFETEKKAKEWVKSHSLKGKEETILTTPTRIKGTEVLEEVDGPMGITLYKQKLEADYTIEYTKFDEETRDNKLNTLLHKRDDILLKTNWLFISDVKVEQKHRKYYVEYRDYLRNLEKTIGNSEIIGMEEFDHWLRRKYSEEFMDGGNSEKIINKFKKHLD